MFVFKNIVSAEWQDLIKILLEAVDGTVGVEQPLPLPVTENSLLTLSPCWFTATSHRQPNLSVPKKWQY